VVFPREVRARALADPRVAALAAAARSEPGGEARALFERTLGEVLLEKQAEVAAEFDAIHSVERALEVGSVHAIIPAADLRPRLIDAVERGLRNGDGPG
jgi:hypothetical protein